MSSPALRISRLPATAGTPAKSAVRNNPQPRDELNVSIELSAAGSIAGAASGAISPRVIGIDAALWAFGALPLCWQRRRPIDDLSAHGQPKTAVRQFLKLDTLLAPHLFDGPHRRAAGLGVALLEFVNSALGHPNAKSELALTPPQDRTRRPDLGGKSAPLEPHELDEVRGTVGVDLYGHGNKRQRF
jgi:hypothetical protein